MSVAVSNRIGDLTSVLRTTEDHSITQLQDIAQELDVWKTKVCTVSTSSSNTNESLCRKLCNIAKMPKMVNMPSVKVCVNTRDYAIDT